MAEYNTSTPQGPDNNPPQVQPPAAQLTSGNGQSYIVYVPQVSQPNVLNYSQAAPGPHNIQYQYAPQSNALVQPQQQQQYQYQQQQQYQPQTYQQQLQQPLVPQQPQTPIAPLVYKHDLIQNAGPAEQKYFLTRTLGAFTTPVLLSVIMMAITSTNPREICGITYNLHSEHYTWFFYVCCVVFGLVTLTTLLKHQAVKTASHKYVVYGVWSFSFVFIFQGAYSSSYYYYTQYYGTNSWSYIYEHLYGPEMIYGMILVVMQYLALIAAVQTQKTFNYQTAAIFIIPSIGIFELIIYLSTHLHDDGFFAWSSACALILSFYFAFLIQKIQQRGLMLKRTNETILAPIFWFAIIFMPFFDNEE